MANTPKIYTRTGDRGETSLIGGMRVLKSSERVDTYGTVDELNSTIGVIVAHLKRMDDEELLWMVKGLEKIQNDLFDVGSILANPQHSRVHKAAEEKHFLKAIDSFEHLIDQMTKQLQPLRNFILPGGSIAGAYLHMARTVCRRTERRLVNLAQQEEVDTAVVKYFNRLSDLLFTMARFINAYTEEPETHWVTFAKTEEKKKLKG